MTRDVTGRICGPCRVCMTESDQLRADLEFARTAARSAWADLEAARKEVERLREALRKYGRHEKGCGRVRVLPAKLEPYRPPCTCGLDTALAGPGGG